MMIFLALDFLLCYINQGHLDTFWPQKKRVILNLTVFALLQLAAFLSLIEHKFVISSLLLDTFPFIFSLHLKISQWDKMIQNVSVLKSRMPDVESGRKQVLNLSEVNMLLEMINQNDHLLLNTRPIVFVWLLHKNMQ